MRISRIKYLIPIIIGGIALFIPLLGNFHIESAVLVSLIGCFWAGWKACDPILKTDDDFRTALTIAGYLYLSGLPLLVTDLFTGCFSIHGLGFWLIYPLPGTFFGYAIGRLARMWNISRRRLLTFGILLVVAAGITVYELFTYPQVYFYNHVWGSWPGPIYDETVELGKANLFFRTLTILWISLLWNIPAVDRNNKVSMVIVILSVASLGLGYTQLNEMGVLSSTSYIEEQLGGIEETEHFEIYYDLERYSNEEITRLALRHEFYLDQITDKLQVNKPDSNAKIQSYLYANPWQKKKMTGAKFTSYVPVWLKRDQLHIAKQQIGGSLEHELVHVVAKRFGNRLFNASWSIGMIEGLAVALAGGSSPRTTIDQIVVSEKPYPGSEELQHAFSPFGFYGGRSGVNYTTCGSFVRYLITGYPVENIKKAYRLANIPEAYDTDWEKLTEEWHQVLDTVEVDTIDRQVASRIFGIPSLFEQDCPRVQSDFARAWDHYRLYRAGKDTARMLHYLDKALRHSAGAPGVKSEWVFQHLIAGHVDTVTTAIAPQDTSVDLQLLYADAFALADDWGSAQRHLERGRMLFAQNPDSVHEPAIATRQDERQWRRYLELRYEGRRLGDSEFAESYYRTKIRAIRQAIDERQWNYLENYGRRLLQYPLHMRYFDVYLDLIHYLGYRSNFETAHLWIDRLKEEPLRPRYRERLQKEEQWIFFLKAQNS